MAARQSLFTRVVRATLTKKVARVAPVMAVAFGLGLGAAACSDDFTPVAVGDLPLDVEPQRVVSMSATATEMLFAIGAGDKVVAVDNFSNFPAEVDSLPKIDAYEPSVEA
ncbi:MAG: ABC transporter substrate-binding protein, partial [Ilumatobacteraceae bacterium]